MLEFLQKFFKLKKLDIFKEQLLKYSHIKAQT